MKTCMAYLRFLFFAMFLKKTKEIVLKVIKIASYIKKKIISTVFVHLKMFRIFLMKTFYAKTRILIKGKVFYMRKKFFLF